MNDNVNLIEELSDTELEGQIMALQLVQNERKAARKADFIEQIEGLARAINMSVVLSEIPPKVLAIAEAPEKAKRIIHPKYKHPDDDRTWTGRGVAPLWVAEIEEKGITRESMLINKPEVKDQPVVEPVVEPTEGPVVETPAVAKRSHSKKKEEVKED